MIKKFALYAKGSNQFFVLELVHAEGNSRFWRTLKLIYRIPPASAEVP